MVIDVEEDGTIGHLSRRYEAHRINRVRRRK